MRRLVLLLLMLLLVPAGPARAESGGCWVDAPRCQALVDARHVRGLPGLDQDRDLQAEAQVWAQRMADAGVLSHSDIGFGGEIVGTGPDTATIIVAFLASPAHRALLLDPAYRRVGVGHAWSGGRLWLSVRFDYLAD